MAVALMSEVFRSSRTTLGARLVLLAIADNADEETREAWPSIRTLAQKACLSESAVHRGLRRAVTLGELQIVVRPREGEANLSNMYRLLPLGAKTTPRGVSPETPEGIASGTDLGVASGTRTIRREPSENHQKRGFAQFYEPYPKKRHRPDAEKAWRQVDGDAHLEAILAGVARWVGSEQWRGGRIEDPSTFLRNRQWEDPVPAAPKLTPPRDTGPRRPTVPSSDATKRMLALKGIA